jgi:hypothetical protein
VLVEGLGILLDGLKLKLIVLGQVVWIIDVNAFVDEFNAAVIIFLLSFTLLAVVRTWVRLSNFILSFAISDFPFVFHEFEFLKEFPGLLNQAFEFFFLLAIKSLACHHGTSSISLRI